jgi:hypothetical protein
MSDNWMAWRVLCAASVFVISVLALTFSLSNVSSASKVPFTPAIIARAGMTNVFYVLSESNACSIRECLRLERSNNGGRTFFPETVPPITPVHGGDVAPIYNLYFANPTDGYAEEFTSTGAEWASTSLFLTRDGGHSWGRVSIARHVSIFGFASTSRYFYALTEQCSVGKKGKCSHIQLNRSSARTSKWSSLAIPRQISRYPGNIQVAAFGSRVWLSTQNEDSPPFSPYLATSQNAGSSFTVAAQPQLSSVGSCGLLPVSEEVLWAECDQGMMHGDIPYSRDGGVRWQFDQKNQLGQFGFGVFEPVGDVAYFINEMHPRTLFRTTSEAAIPRAVGTMPSFTWASLDMTNGKQGLALSAGPGGSSLDILWRTTDGGEHWSRVEF